MPKSCPRCHHDLDAAWKFCPFDGSVIVEDEEDAPPPSTNREIIETFEGFSPRATRFSGAIVGGRYRIVGFVNKGATARVYLAEDLERPTEIVAIKLFAPVVRERQAMREQFLREADALRAIDHENVVRVLDAGELDGAPYVVMEALRGETIGNVLERTPVLPDETALRYFREAASGLAAAHRVGVVHRDVKPDNLFLVRSGNETKLKVIDFGMARVRDSGTNPEGLVMGTVQYMAPEQIVSEPVDPRTDIYGLAVVLFRMLTGHLPFDVELGTDLLAHQLFSPAPPPSWLDDDLDPNIERVILCAMRKHPDNRYPTMEAFLEDLARERSEGWPMLKRPDVYEPMTDQGTEAAKFLGIQFGR